MTLEDQFTVEQQLTDKQLEKYVDKKTELEEEINVVSKQYQELIKQSTKFKQEKEQIHNKNSELALIEKFNQTNEKTYWEYTSLLEMCCKGQINILNQELFQLALELNQAYIVKNKEKIIQNLKLFLPDEEKGIHICQNFYESTEIYELERLKEKGATIKIMYGYKKGKKADTQIGRAHV